jgi:hypothetical protein
MQWILAPFAAFVEDPWLILVPTGLFAAMTAYLFIVSKHESPSRARAWVLLIVTCLWGAYAVWEAMVFRRTQSLPPGPVIRADLVLIALGLLPASLIGLGAFIGGILRVFTTPVPQERRSWQDPAKTREPM